MKNSLVIQTLKKISLSFLALSLTACNFLGDHSKAPEPMEETSKKQATQKEDAEAYVVQPNYDHPKFKELDAAFKKQKHRFEIDRCEFKYNDQSIFIGDSYDKIIEIFGKPDEKPVFTSDKISYSIEYSSIKLFIRFFSNTNKLKSFTLRLSDYEEPKNIPYEIIKFRKVPYKEDMTLNDFTELCDLNHNKTLGHDLNTFNIINEKVCESVIESIDTAIGSQPSYKTIGGGHMTLRGDFDPTSTGPIEYLSISIKKN
ncbi:hypothetical protein [uncultured Nonlabens sp.]|uniref:DUF7738 domain-containing protein n=1 Tax=uncultured Nonlabens sp. TaxID=859306 RepID=UPI0026384911|nr:hypothetical protein [uncultured Nonlabens sp.]